MQSNQSELTRRTLASSTPGDPRRSPFQCAPTPVRGIPEWFGACEKSVHPPSTPAPVLRHSISVHQVSTVPEVPETSRGQPFKEGQVRGDWAVPGCSKGNSLQISIPSSRFDASARTGVVSAPAANPGEEIGRLGAVSSANSRHRASFDSLCPVSVCAVSRARAGEQARRGVCALVKRGTTDGRLL